MADTTALKNRIRAAVKANDNQEITGPVLQQALLDIVDELNGATETEADARQNGDSTLQQSINTEKQRITNEIQRAQSAEQILQQNINTEAGQRQSAEQILQQNINTEAGQRQSADNFLQNKVCLLFDFVDGESVGTVTNGKNAQCLDNGKVYTANGTSAHNLLQYTLSGEKYLKCKYSAGPDQKYAVGVIFVDGDNKILFKQNEDSWGTHNKIFSVPTGATKVYVNGTGGVVPECTSGTLSNTPSYKAETRQCRAEIQQEADARQNGDSTLQQSINTEKQRITNETQRAQGAEQTLQQNINTEAVQRQNGDNIILNKIQPLYEQDFVDGESVGTVTNGKNAQRLDNGKVYIADDSSVYNLLQYTLSGEKYLKCYCTASADTAYGAGVIFADDNDNILSQYNNQTSGNHTVVLSVPEGATKVYVNGINITPTCTSQNLVKTPIYSEEIKVLDENLLKTEYIDVHLGTVKNAKQAQVINGNQLHIATGDQSYNMLTYTLNNELFLKCKYSAGPSSYAVGVIFVDGDNKILFKQNEDSWGTHNKIFSVPTGATKVYVNGTGRVVPECVLATTRKSFSFSFEYADYISPKVSLSLFENIGIIGDSYASGELYYNSGYHDKYSISWGQQIARKFGIQCINFSSGGLSTRSWLTADKGLPKLLNDPAQDLYLFVLGINDYYHLGIDYLGTIEDITSHESYVDYGDTFYGNYGRIIEQTAEHAPNAKLIMIGLAGTGELPITFDTAIREIAAHYSIPYINQKDDNFYLEPVYTDMAGGHPTAIGYARMAIAFERLLSKCILDNIQYFRNYKMYD